MLASLRNFRITGLLLTGASLLITRPSAAQTDFGIQWMRSGHSNPVLSVAVSPGGSQFTSAVGFGDPDLPPDTARIWSATTGDLVRTYPFWVYAPTVVAYSPDGARIATAHGEHIEIRRVSDGALLVNIPNVYNSQELVFSPDGTYLAEASHLDEQNGVYYCTAHVWDSSGNLKYSFVHPTDPTHPHETSIAFSADSTKLATLGNEPISFPIDYEPSIRIWSLQSGAMLGSGVFVPSGVFSSMPEMRGVAFSSNGAHLITNIDPPGNLVLWDVTSNNGQLICEPRYQSTVSGYEWQIKRHTNSDVFAASGLFKVGLLRVSWGGGSVSPSVSEVASETLGYDSNYTYSPRSIDLSGDGSRLAVADTQVSLYNTAGTFGFDLSLAVQPQVLRAPPISVDFMPGGSTLFVTCQNGDVRVLDTASGAVVRQGLVPDSVTVSKLSTNRQTMITGHASGEVSLWSVSDLTRIDSWFFNSPVTSVDLTSDGQTVVAGTQSGELAFWYVSSGMIYLLQPYSSSVSGIAVSPDGSYVASVDTSFALKYWRLSDRKLLKNVTPGGSDLIKAVFAAFTPDGGNVAVGQTGGLVDFYSFPTGSFVGGNIDPNVYWAIAFAPDGSGNYALAADGFWGNPGLSVFEVDVWGQGNLVGQHTTEVGTGVHCLAYSPDGRYIAYGRADPTVALITNPYWLKPGSLVSVDLSPTAVSGGASATLAIKLNNPSSGPVTINLSSDDPNSASVPSSVTVPAGSSSVTQQVTTVSVTLDRQVTLTATQGSRSFSAVLTVRAPVVSSVTLTPTSVTGGANATLKVTLGAAAPVATSVSLSSNDTSAATVPASVTVPAGSSSATATVTTYPVAANASVTLKATVASSSRTAALTVKTPVLSAISVSPTSVAGGKKATGKVTISGKAPAAGVTVALSSSNAAIAKPVDSAGAQIASVLVPAGATTASFSIATAGVAASQQVTFKATLAAVTKQAILTVAPPKPSSVAVAPAIVTGSLNATGKVTLEAPVVVDTTISLAVTAGGSAVASIPATVVVAAGATSKTFVISTKPVTSTTAVTVQASANGASKSGSFSVRPPIPIKLTFNPSTVQRGGTSNGTVTLDVAPLQNLTVTLSAVTNASAVSAMPANVTVVAGSTTATFLITINGSTTFTSAKVQATSNGASASGTLKITL